MALSELACDSKPGTDMAGPPKADTLCPPRVSIVIPCRNEASHIADCLRSVLRFEPVPGGYEVIVADGMSTDGTREIVSRFVQGDSRIRMVDNPARTTPSGLNIGIQAAKGDLIARIDAHTEYSPNYLRECIAVMEETGADNVGGPALTKATSYVHRAIAAAYHSRFAVGNSVFHQPDHEGPADTVPYGCYSRARLIELGLFDEELVRNQDDELNFRLIRAGGTIWQSPRIKSWYTPRSSLLSLFRQYFQYGYWKVRVIQKHGTPASLRHLVPGAFAATLVALSLMAPFFMWALLALAFVLGLYTVGVAVASLITASQTEWVLLPALPPAFAAYHMGYGFGFLCGVWDFIVRKRAKGRFVALTRS